MKKSVYSSANYLSNVIGHPPTLIIVLIVVIGLFLTGQLFHFNDSLYRSIEFAIALLTFIMTFVIHSSHRADFKALNRKMDEPIKARPEIDNSKVELEKRIKRGENV